MAASGTEIKKFDMEAALDSVDYSFPNYKPTNDALEFFALMRMVEGTDFEFSTPLAHYFMVDVLFGNVTADQFPYSKEVNDTIAINSHRVAIVASRGLAKALPLHYEVKSPSGYKTIATTQIGDKVFDRDGKVCTVIGKSEVFDKPMYRMILADGRVVDMSEDHDNIVWKRFRGNSKKSRGLEEVVLTAKELYDGGISTNRTPTLKNPKARDNKYYIPCLTIFPDFPEVEFGMDPYTVGVILGDGSIDSKHSNFMTTLTTHKDDFYCYESNIPYGFGVKQWKKIDGTQQDCFSVSLLGASRDVEKWIGACNSYTKKIPEQLLNGSANQRLEVLKGLMDTDGTVYKNGAVAFTSTSIDLATGVMDIVRSLGGIASIREEKTPSPFGRCWRVYIKTMFPVFKLQRKLDRCRYYPKNNKVAIESIERISNEPSQCIAVDSPTKSFLTNGWTVTHNSTVVTSFYPIYCAIKGELPCGDKTRFHLLLGASAQGGAKVMSKAVQAMCEDSVFCKGYFEEMSFTETESRFIRKGPGKAKSRAFLVRYLGIGGNIRGNRDNYGERYDHAIMDDVILNTQAAYSEIQMGLLRELISSDLENGLVGGMRGRIFSVATPFRLGDPVVETLVGGGYTPVLLPICETIHKDMTKDEFKGAWPSMHPYEAVIRQYKQAAASGATKSFNQERMLRISSEDDRMIQEDMIEWYSRKDLLKDMGAYNIYITTDFTTTSEAKSDFSALSVWAINSNSDFYLVDLCVRRQGIGEQYNELFRMVEFWSAQGKAVEVGVEIDGQQKSHIFSLKEMMIKRSTWFTFARQKGSKYGSEGILSRSSGGNKHERFRLMLPHFQNHKFHFPVELENTPDMVEALKQLKYTTWENFGAHDDFNDTISQLGLIDIRLPMISVGSYSANNGRKGDSIWADAVSEDEDGGACDSYV